MRRILVYGGVSLVVLGAILIGIEVYSRAPGTLLPPMAGNANIGLETTGVVFVMFGLAAFVLASVRRAMPARLATASEKTTDETPNQLSRLELHLLLNLRYTKNEKDLAKATSVDRDVVSDKLDQLFERGYVTQKTGLTEKGYDAVNDYLSSQQGQSEARTSPAPASGTFQESRDVRREPSGGRTGELALGIILVLISLSVLIYLGIVGSTPFIGAFFLQSYLGLAAVMVLLMIIGIGFLFHSQAR